MLQPDRARLSTRLGQLAFKTLSVALILGLIAVLSISIVNEMRHEANEIDANRSISAVNAAVSSSRKKLTLVLRDNAIWDDAYVAVGTDGAAGWIEETWGTTSENYPAYDGIVVFDPNGVQVKAYMKGQEFDALSAFGPELAWQALAASISPSTEAQQSFFLLGDRATMVATLAIQPYATKAGRNSYHTLTLFKELAPDYVRSIADEFQVPGLTVTATVDGDQLAHRLEDRSNRTIGFLSWPRSNPGDTVYSHVFPKLAALWALFAVFLVIIVLFSYIELRKERARAAKAIHHATHDSLTGLLNRAGLVQAISDAPPGSIVHLIDLDGFKAVNDAWGHAVGDRLISLVAARLQIVRQDVTEIARIGGDEFALLQPADADAGAMGKRIVKLLQDPFPIDGRTVEIGASVGIAVLLPDLSALEVIRRADMALYLAKDSGRGQAATYTPELDISREVLEAEERRLKSAIVNDEIEVAFQPLAAAANGAIVGVEALARWNPPTGPVSPETFVALAERSGLIDMLSKKVIESAIRAVIEVPDLDLSVNVSPLQLSSPTFADEIKAVLAAEKFPPSRLILEVTEGVFIDKPDRAMRSIRALRKIGIRFALDDFGTGNASIGTLRRFGFDKVKIDRSLMTDENAAVLKATIQLASALDVPVTAEGIETEQQAERARDAGCELLQGYLLGKAMPYDQLMQRLAQAARARNVAAVPDRETRPLVLPERKAYVQ